MRFYGAVITASNDNVAFLDVEFRQMVDSEVDDTIPREVLISAGRLDIIRLGDLFAIRYIAQSPGPVDFVVDRFQWNTGLPEVVFVTGNKLTIQIDE